MLYYSEHLDITTYTSQLAKRGVKHCIHMYVVCIAVMFVQLFATVIRHLLGSNPSQAMPA
jgi:hypothetical protein